MAKKKAARGGFNMSAEIRALLQANPASTGREVYEALRSKFPGESINENSCNVAFSNSRRKLGLGKSGGKKTVRRQRPAAAAAKAARTVEGSVSLEAIRAACDLLAKAGSVEAAVGILKSLQPLNR